MTELEKYAVETTELEPWYQRPVSSTIGRLSAPATALTVGSMAPFHHTISGEEPFAKSLVEAAGQDPDIDKDMPLKINYGGVHPISSLGRVWKNPHTGILTKLMGTAGLPFGALASALTRGDHYSPYSHDITLYNSDPAIMAHELGHAKDFAATDYPGLYSMLRAVPFGALYQEGIASTNAVELLRKAKLKSEVARANRVLGGGFGSYVGGAFGNPLVGGLAGQAVGAATQPFGKAEKQSSVIAGGIHVG